MQKAAVVFWVVFLIGCSKSSSGGGGASEEKRSVDSNGTKNNPPPVASISVDKLFTEYGENEIAADGKYKGKYVELEGTVVSVEKDNRGRFFLGLSHMHGYGYPPTTICLIPVDREKEFATIRSQKNAFPGPWKNAKVIGKVKGRKSTSHVDGYKNAPWQGYIIEIEDCRLVGTPKVPESLLFETIYKRAISSVAVVEVFNEKQNKQVGGSAAIIDKNRKLVLTAYHVVENAQTINIIFPKHVGGKLVTDPREYARPDRIFAKIWKADPSKDLAILQVDWVPPESRALPLAAASPEPGEETYTIGDSPKASIGLWTYSKGNVREVNRDTCVLDNNRMIDAWMVRARYPVNQEGSGGEALINKNCELAGVCCASKPSADGIRAFIDVREVKILLGLK